MDAKLQLIPAKEWNRFVNARCCVRLGAVSVHVTLYGVGVVLQLLPFDGDPQLLRCSNQNITYLEGRLMKSVPDPGSMKARGHFPT